MSVTHVDKISRGLYHLESAFKHKFIANYPTRAPHAPKAFVQPKDRIRRWNIRPGDSVRLMVGKPSEKFIDGAVGVTSGYKVYKVASVDMERNRLYLEGLTNNKSNRVQLPPTNGEELDDETLTRLKQQQNFIKTRRPVNYSNVQLCLEDKGPDSVFATRLGNGGLHFNRAAHRPEWRRYAAATSAPSSLEPDAKRGLVEIAWPESKKREEFPMGRYDTDEKHLVAATVEFGKPSSIPETLLPRSMRAKPPSDQDYSDEYIFRPSARTNPVMQAAMPLYLGEELSPRFSRAKQTAGYNERRRVEAAQRVEFARQAVDKWEAGGRDAGLDEVLSTDLVNLHGLTLRHRTRKEVREAALAEADAQLAETKAFVAHAHAMEMSSDGHGGFIEGKKVKRIERKIRRKARKAEKIEERLEKLTLKEEKNQFVPYELRQ